VVAAALTLLVASGTACSMPLEPSRREAVDTLDFVLGDPSLWPRTGTQWQHQTIDRARREVCWTKYGDRDKFECWRWDDEWIYHTVDHGIDGNTGESYEFSDGRWLPRSLASTWSLEIRDNRVRWFDRGCRLNAAKSGAAPYRMRAWIERRRMVSVELLMRDVLVLEYSPGAAGDHRALERFSFAEGAGWYLWESARGDARFDRRGGPAVPRGRACGE
jgi:hypothetical protein